MPAAKLLACPRCQGADNIVRRHRRPEPAWSGNASAGRAGSGFIPCPMTAGRRFIAPILSLPERWAGDRYRGRCGLADRGASSPTSVKLPPCSA
jgi:hypothetical protein